MIKTLCIFLVTSALAGCIWVVDDDYSHREDPYTYSSYDFWFEEVYVSCDYDYWTDISSWSFTAYTGGTEWIEGMHIWLYDLYAAGSSVSANLYFGGADMWTGWLDTYEPYCGHTVDLEFVAYDGYGTLVYTTVWW